MSFVDLPHQGLRPSLLRTVQITSKLNGAVSEGESDEVIRELARRLVTDLAPEELPLFRPISDAYLRDPSRTLDKRHDHDEVLGFGVDAVVVLMTPVVLAIVRDVIMHLRARLVEEVAKEGGEIAGGWLHRLFGPLEPPAGANVPALSPAQLAEVRRRAYERALALKLSETKANVLADSLTAQLATQAST